MKKNKTFIIVSPVNNKNGEYIGVYVQFNDRDREYLVIKNNDSVDWYFSNTVKMNPVEHFNKYGEKDIDTIGNLFGTDRCVFSSNDPKTLFMNEFGYELR